MNGKVTSPNQSVLLATRPDFDCPGELRIERCICQAIARLVAKIDHVIEGWRLPAAAEIDEGLAVVIEFVK